MFNGLFMSDIDTAVLCLIFLTEITHIRNVSVGIMDT